MSDPTVFPERPRVAIATGAVLGEGAIWDHRTGTLFFVDIKAHCVWRWTPHGGDARGINVHGEVGFVLLTSDPDAVVVGLRSGLARLDLRDGQTELLVSPEPEKPGNRLNDGCAGPDGSVFFGSMDDAEREPTGRFFHWTGMDCVPFGENAVVPNGPAFDPDRGLLYCSDTPAGRIYRHRLAPDGTPGPREPFVTFREGWGHPDGMAVDEEGCVWVCHWGGSRVTRFSPEGTPLLEVPVPTAQVTKVAFGGSDLGTLYITTAAIGRDREIDPMAGHVFAVETGIRGRPADLVRLPA